MRKIPTVFKRNPEDLRHLLPEVHPDCQWVLDGGGYATRKYNGTCVMFNGETWWARREIKPGKREPLGFTAIETDPETGKTVGWAPADQSPFYKFHTQAVEAQGPRWDSFAPGTYELCGPKVQGNPEGFDRHLLVRHRLAEPYSFDEPLTYELLAETLPTLGWEGLVWRRGFGGQMAKLKARDFA